MVASYIHRHTARAFYIVAGTNYNIMNRTVVHSLVAIAIATYKGYNKLAIYLINVNGNKASFEKEGILNPNKKPSIHGHPDII